LFNTIVLKAVMPIGIAKPMVNPAAKLPIRFRIDETSGGDAVVLGAASGALTVDASGCSPSSITLFPSPIALAQVGVQQEYPG